MNGTVGISLVGVSQGHQRQNRNVVGRMSQRFLSVLEHLLRLVQTPVVQGSHVVHLAQVLGFRVLLHKGLDQGGALGRLAGLLQPKKLLPFARVLRQLFNGLRNIVDPELSGSGGRWSLRLERGRPQILMTLGQGCCEACSHEQQPNRERSKIHGCPETIDTSTPSARIAKMKMAGHPFLRTRYGLRS